MRIRRKAQQEYEAISNTGDLNRLIEWLQPQDDFNSMSVTKDLRVVVVTADLQTIALEANDWIRLNEESKFDRIRAAAFATNWEVVNE